MILDTPGGGFSGYRARARCHLGCQNRAKFVKKLMRKIVDFLIGLGSEESEKKESKITLKWSRPERNTRGKLEKCKNEYRFMVFAWFYFRERPKLIGKIFENSFKM